MDQATATAAEEARSGAYEPQPGSYSAFIPSSLPPDPPVEIDGEMQALLSKADRALGRLDGSIQTLPHPELFVFMYVRKEAVLSSRIEGTESSINDVLEVEAQVYDAEHPRDVNEVLNYIYAMNQGLKRLADIPISVRVIREIHECLMRRVRGKDRQPGEIRTKQNWIGPNGCTLQEATFVPPPPAVVPDALAQLENFLHTETPNLPILIKIGLAHAQFETIHPFLDGNGRVGRLLITFLLCEREVLIKPVLYISHYFRQYQDQYYQLLQNIRDNGEWEPWIKFFLNGVATVSNEATETARQIVELRESHRNQITAKFGRAAGNGLKALEYMYQRPIVRVKDIEDLLVVTYAAANQLVGRFVDAGFLQETTGHARNRRFRYGPYIQLFADT